MKKVLFVISFLVSANAFSITLPEIRQLAIERSSSLNAQQMEERALRNESVQKGKWQNPQIMSQFGHLDSGTTKGSTAEISLTQAFPLSDKFSLRKEMAQLATGMMKTQSNYFKNWVAHQSVLSAWRVHVSHELFKHGVERARRLGLVKKYLDTRPKVSIKQRVELSIISSLLLQLEKMQDLKKLDLEMDLNDLEFWIGRKVNPTEIPLKLPQTYDVLADFQMDTLNDLELVRAKNNLKTSALDRELAGKERRPDIFLGAGYRVENVSPANHFSYAIVGLNIPIWDTGSSRSEAAKAREMRDQKELEEAEKRLKLKHQNQINLVENSVLQLKRFPRKFVQANDQAVLEAETGFRQSLLDVNTFLQAETQSHEVIDQVFMSWISYLENLSSLQLIRGEELRWEKQ